MLYYKVKNDFYTITNKKTKYFLQKNELLTQKELLKITNNTNTNNFNLVQIPKNKTFFSFGYRFIKGF